MNTRTSTLAVALGLLLAACGERPEGLELATQGPPAGPEPPAPPAPPPPATVTGIYWGFYTFDFGASGGVSGFGFGDPLIVDGAGRAMWLVTMSSTDGFVFDADFSTDGEALAAGVTVRRFPTAERWTGVALGTLDAEGNLDVPNFPVGDSAGERARFGIAEGGLDEAATGLNVDLAELNGTYAGIGDSAFDSDGNPFEMSISLGGAVTLGSCWSGQVELVEAGKPVVRVLDGSPLCPTDEHLSGLIAVFEDQLFVLLVDENSDRSYVAYFPR